MPLRRFLIPAVVVTVVALASLWAGYLIGRDTSPPRGEPVLTRSYFAEKNGPAATGRVCAQVVVSSPRGVAVALSCSYPPAEDRLANLLEGAGQ
jgi:hypothetical protein